MESRWSILLLTFLAGSVAGSIAKRIVYRAPTNLPLFRDGSTCPQCGQPSPLTDFCPILPYVLARGRRKCGHRISVRDPLIELTVAISWVLVVARLGLGPELPAFLTLMASLVTLSAIDLEHRRILNRLLGPMTIAGTVLLVAAAFVLGQPRVLLRCFLGALAYFIPMLLLALVIPSSMGMGDVKLAGYLGLHLGWFSMLHVLVGAFLGFLTGAVIGIALIIAGKKGRKDYVPFGPSMALGAAFAVLLGGLPNSIT